MTTMAEIDRVVTGGVDTHTDVHVAAVVDNTGRILGSDSFPTTSASFRRLLAWMQHHGTIGKIGVEGTGAYGAGLARFLADAGIEVVEVDRPNRQLRRSRGKSDTIDAEHAARAVLSGEATAAPKARNGTVECVRALRVVRRSAVVARGVAPLPASTGRTTRHRLDRAATAKRTTRSGASPSSE